MGPPRGIPLDADRALRALSPLSRTNMAARVSQHPRSGLVTYFDGSSSNTPQRRYRAVSQNRAAYSRSSSSNSAIAPRSVSVHRAPGNLYTTQRTATPPGGRQAPLRPTRGPIITPNRKASAPSRLTSSCSEHVPSGVSVRRRPSPHSNAVAGNNFSVHNSRPQLDHSVNSSDNSSLGSSSSSGAAASHSSSGAASHGSSGAASHSSSSVATAQISPSNVRSTGQRLRKTTAPVSTRTPNSYSSKANLQSRSTSQPVTSFDFHDKLPGGFHNVNINNNNNNVCVSSKKLWKLNNVLNNVFNRGSSVTNAGDNQYLVRHPRAPATNAAAQYSTKQHLLGQPCALATNSDIGLTYSPSLSPIHSVEQSPKFNCHEAGFLDDLPCEVSPVQQPPRRRRISKDHGGGKSGQGSQEAEVVLGAAVEDRKLSAATTSTAPILPAKRVHSKDQEPDTASEDQLICTTDNKSSKPLKYKKMATVANKREGKLLQSDEAMDTQFACTVQTLNVPSIQKETMSAVKLSSPQTIVVSKSATSPPKSSSKEDFEVSTTTVSTSVTVPQVSATITINSVVPELSSTVTPVIVSNPKPSFVEPVVPVRRNSRDSTDGSKKHYALKQSTTQPVVVEPVKSVSITNLESDSCAEPKRTALGTDLAASKASTGSQRKASPTKSYLASDFAPLSKGEAVGEFGIYPDNTRKTSATSTKLKNDGVAVAAEDDLSKFDQEKIIRLEKMVSDLVKNAEIKKQEIAALKMEIKRLKEVARNDEAQHRKVTTSTPNAGGDVADRLEELLEDNRSLRAQLLHLGGSLNSSHLSDQEKEALLKGGSWGERSTTGATIGDWDAKSSCSEVSVACLQDRIMQMEETHYCTNEELQATLQELDDLREQLMDSQAQLQQLTDDKYAVLETVRQQEDMLCDAREQNSTLTQLLIQHSENSHTMSNCVNSQKLLELLKTMQEDRERLLAKDDELQAQISAAVAAEEKFRDDSHMYRERMKSLETLLEASVAGKLSAESQTADLHDSIAVYRMETTRLQAALAAAKEKVGELEARLVGGGSAGEKVLEVVRSEKERLEQQVVELTQQQHVTSCEADKLREHVAGVTDKLQKAEASARDGLHSASARSERMEEQRRTLVQQVAAAEAALSDAKQTAQRHLQHKRELKTALSDVQKRLTQALEAKLLADDQLQREKDRIDQQVEEWDQFQSDLLTTVRVANDFKTETQAQFEQLQQDNSLLKHQVMALEKQASGPAAAGSAVASRRVAERPVEKPPLSRADSRVKSLIESLEGGTGSRSRTPPAVVDGPPPAIPVAAPAPQRKTAVPLLKRPDTEGMSRTGGGVASPLKESGNIECSGSPPLRTLHRDGYSKVAPPPSSPTANLPDTVKMSQLGEKAGSKLTPDAKSAMAFLCNKVEVKTNNYTQLSSDKKDPLALLTQGGGSKRNALLKWCQNKTLGYTQVDITNFSSSWNDGLALCAILDTYIPDKINYRTLNHANKRANFETGLAAAESVGISSTLDINDMINSERPNWQTVYNYVTSIYAHFET